MKVLALDISKSATGVAVGDATAPPRCDLAQFKGRTVGAVGAAYWAWLNQTIVLEKPDLIAAEAAFSQSKDHYGAMLAMGMNFITQTQANKRSIPFVSFASQSWRRLFLGNGRPADPKKEAVNMCHLLGWPVGLSHDKAEACGVWSAAHLEHGNSRGIHRLLSHGSVRAMGAA